MTKRIAFSKRSLELEMSNYDGKRLVLHDERQPGLIAELRSGSRLSFYLYRWANGRPHRIRIGAFPATTVEQARDQAKLLLADLVNGTDVAAVKRARREEATLKDLFTHWLDNHAKLHKKTWQEDERQFNKMLKSWHNRHLSTIKKADVAALHTRLGEDNGRYAANRLLALLRAMFNRAGDVGFDGPNPTKGIKKFKERSRDRFLQPSELPVFFASVQAEPNQTLKDFFLTCLYTGARRSNVEAMRWKDLELDSSTWRIPDTKSGEPVTLHLAAPAVELLRARKESLGGSEWVFPGGRKNQASHLSSPKTAWQRLLKRAGLEDLRLHDLRRTLGSWQAAGGASLTVIGKSLGHKSLASTAVYARLNLDPVRASVDAATSAMLSAVKASEGMPKA